VCYHIVPLSLVARISSRTEVRTPGKRLQVLRPLIPPYMLLGTVVSDAFEGRDIGADDRDQRMSRATQGHVLTRKSISPKISLSVEKICRGLPGQGLTTRFIFSLFQEPPQNASRIPC
jgi:hypothetical protein